MEVESHLVLKELALQPSGEWTPAGRGWVVARLHEGFGYWLQGSNVRELKIGDGFVVEVRATARVRASQLGGLKLQFFTVLPHCLKGILNLIEWRQLETTPVAARGLVFDAHDLLGQKFSRLAAQTRGEDLARRCALLQFWAGAIAEFVDMTAAKSGKSKLREQFWQLLGRLPESEVSEYSLADLADQLHCSRRYIRLVFREELGVKFGGRAARLRPAPSSLGAKNIGAAPPVAAKTIRRPGTIKPNQKPNPGRQDGPKQG